MKRGQVTPWIIVGIVLVVIIGLVLVLNRNVNDVTHPLGGDSDLISYLDSCTAPLVWNAQEIMLPQGGFIQPESFVYYNRTRVEYICQTWSYFEPCVQQHPLFIKEMEQEINDYIYSDVSNCFDSMKDEFGSRGWAVEFSSPLELEVDLKPDKVVLKLDKTVSVQREDSSKTYDDFEVKIDSPLYNLGIIAQEIANMEATNCYFETAGYSMTYPRYKVTRKMMSHQPRIYFIEDKRMNRQMIVAVRSCALPEGMPG